MAAAIVATATTRALPRRVKNVRAASCAADLAHVKSSSMYLAHLAMAHASLSSHRMRHRAGLSRTPVDGMPPTPIPGATSAGA
jgi:hypothetical protein